MTDVHSLEDHPLAQGVADANQGARAVERDRRRPILRGTGPIAMDWRQSLGFGAIGLGAIGIVVSWFQIAGERELWKQLPYLASGGIGGAAAIAIGIALLIAYEHSADRAALDVVLDRLDDLDDRLDQTGVAGAPTADAEDLANRVAELEAALKELRRPARSARSASPRAASTRNGR